MKKVKVMALAALVSLVFFNSCDKDQSGENNTRLDIRMTDNPFNATEVNVDIQQVRVNFSDDSTGWKDINTYAGVYNLLELQNGVDTLIASGMVPSGMLKEVRFVLGTNNSIVIDSIEYPLTIPSGGSSGLKLKIDKDLNATADSLVIDFDAALSITQTGNGSYMLKPVLKIVD